MTDGLSPAVEQGRGVGQDVLRRHGDGAAGLVPRARLLRAAVGFSLVPPNEAELRVLHVARRRRRGSPPDALRPARRASAARRGEGGYRAVQGGVGNFGLPVATSSGQTMTCLPSCHWVVTALWAI